MTQRPHITVVCIPLTRMHSHGHLLSLPASDAGKCGLYLVGHHAQLKLWRSDLLLKRIVYKKKKKDSINIGGCCCCCCSVVSNSLQLHGLEPTRLLCPWDIPGKNTGGGCHFLLQGIFLTQGLNSYLLHWQTDSLLLSHLGSPLGVLHHVNFPSFIHPSIQFSSVQSLSRVHSLRPHASQHARSPCPSPAPGVHSNSCPSSW